MHAGENEDLAAFLPDGLDDPNEAFSLDNVVCAKYEP